MLKLSKSFDTNVRTERDGLSQEHDRIDTIPKMVTCFITKELSSGKIVEARAFTNVTIFYGEIVIPSSPSKKIEASKLQRVTEEIDRVFRDVIDKYDVYEVATVRPSYMAVSGISPSSSERHATQIASMAIDLVHKLNGFKSNPDLDIKLQLKIGIHSGPCVAGILGRKYRKLCLFGDTIRTVLTLEKFSYPQRISISKQYKTELENVTGFTFERRECIKLNNRQIQTFWLCGKEDSQPDQGIN